jgi:hypothetical protein
MHMQRLSREYRASLILAAAGADSSFGPAEASESRDYGRGRHMGYREDRRVSDGGRSELEDRCLWQEDDDDQPTYWYWSYDHPDAGI